MALALQAGLHSTQVGLSRRPWAYWCMIMLCAKMHSKRQGALLGVSHVKLHLRGCSDVGGAEESAHEAAFCITDLPQRMYALCRFLIQDLFEQMR